MAAAQPPLVPWSAHVDDHLAIHNKWARALLRAVAPLRKSGPRKQWASEATAQVLATRVDARRDEGCLRAAMRYLMAKAAYMAWAALVGNRRSACRPEARPTAGCEPAECVQAHPDDPGLGEGDWHSGARAHARAIAAEWAATAVAWPWGLAWVACCGEGHLGRPAPRQAPLRLGIGAAAPGCC